MPIHYDRDHAVLAGQATVEDAEDFVQWLRERPAATVDLAGCEHVHAAVLQVLLALRPTLVRPPADPWLAAALAPR